MPNCTEWNDAVAHSVIGAIELSFDELPGPTVFDPGRLVVSQFCHREILPGCEGLIFQGLGCEFVIDLAPMNSNAHGSVDADPHLIAANLSDDNLGDDNLDLISPGVIPRCLHRYRFWHTRLFQEPRLWAIGSQADIPVNTAQLAAT